MEHDSDDNDPLYVPETSSDETDEEEWVIPPGLCLSRGTETHTASPPCHTYTATQTSNSSAEANIMLPQKKGKHSSRRSSW